jgi:hypothetical protein
VLVRYDASPFIKNSSEWDREASKSVLLNQLLPDDQWANTLYKGFHPA